MPAHNFRWGRLLSRPRTPFFLIRTQFVTSFTRNWGVHPKHSTLARDAKRRGALAHAGHTRWICIHHAPQLSPAPRTLSWNFPDLSFPGLASALRNSSPAACSLLFVDVVHGSAAISWGLMPPYRFLSAWPSLQSTSPTFISPRRGLRRSTSTSQRHTRAATATTRPGRSTP